MPHPFPFMAIEKVCPDIAYIPQIELQFHRLDRDIKDFIILMIARQRKHQVRAGKAGGYCQSDSEHKTRLTRARGGFWCVSGTHHGVFASYKGTILNRFGIEVSILSTSLISTVASPDATLPLWLMTSNCCTFGFVCQVEQLAHPNAYSLLLSLGFVQFLQMN